MPLFFLLLLSCNRNPQWNAEEATKTIFAPDEMQFRRFEVGMSKVEFDGAYTGTAIYGNENEVIDSLQISEGVYCETAFRFKENYLTEIMVSLIITDENQKNELFEAIEKKLTADYGKGIKDNDQFYWRAEGGTVTTDIFLIDYSSRKREGNDNRYVISLYYTAGTIDA